MYDLFEIIAVPLGYIIDVIYRLVKNYGVSIILFTIVMKLLIFPLTFKSQKAMKKQQKIQPLLAELQKKYANDKEKLSAETMKLYKENDVSMMGGCLPMLIQMPILLGLYRVIQSPLTHLLHVNIKLPETIARAGEIFAQMAEKFPNTIESFKNFTPEKLLQNSQIQLSTWSQQLNGSDDAWAINFNFMGLDLASVPSISLRYIMALDFSNLSKVLLILIPVLAMFTTWLTMKQSQKLTGQNAAANEDNPANSMSKSMNMIAPLMTGFFSFTLPSGLGIYWIISSVTQLIQQYALNKYFDEKEDDFVVKIPEKNRKNSKKRR